MLDLLTLSERTSGSRYEVPVHRFGRPGGRDAYIQAGIHADEIPGLLVAAKLIGRLEVLEKDGALRGEVTVVPVCNPVGLAQRVLGEPEGRYDLAGGQNFNRGFPDLSEAVVAALAPQAGGCAAEALGAAIRHALDALTPATMVEELQHRLLRLGAGAETLLDLHCNHDGELHVFASGPVVDQGVLLARCLGARLLLATEPARRDLTFEDAALAPTLRLSEVAGAQPVRFAATVELRGQRDVADGLAESDCEGILAFLAQRGTIDAAALAERPPAPAPLVVRQDAVVEIPARRPGVLLFHAEAGESVVRGEAVATLVDPASGARTRLEAPVSGRVFSRTGTRYAVQGVVVARIAPPGEEAATRG
jgi:predicted deacylase